MSEDKATVYIKEETEILGFDHDPVDRNGHGEHCIPGCSSVERIVDVNYLYEDRSLITDPVLLEKIRRKEDGTG